MSRLPFPSLIVLGLLTLPGAAMAVDGADDAKKTDTDADSATYEIIYKKSAFTPFELEVAADKKLKIIVKHEGLTPIEFESHQLNREKIVQPGTEAVIYLPPLKPGTYKYFNEFNADQKGFITAK